MQISTILDQIDLSSIALPEFQRGYVWNRDQVRRLMLSLYRRHPVGSLLVWVTSTESADAKGPGPLPLGYVKLLLDGQQRMTSLYGIVRGTPPQFFDGNAQAFTGLHFNLADESFEFYAPAKMKDNPHWVDVTQVMKEGSGPILQRIVTTEAFQPVLQDYIARVNRLIGIKDIDLHIEEVTGEEKTVDVVVDIFNEVNSGGTKLSKGDLALAKICAQWPDARNEMKARLQKWEKAGFYFRLEWFLRCINTVTTGEALFSAFKDVTTQQFRTGMQDAEKLIDKLLNKIVSRLGLDHDRVLGSSYSFPLMVRFVADQGGSLNDLAEADKLLYWYVHTFLWGRYAGSTESVLNQDLALAEEGGLDRLIQQLRQNRGSLEVAPDDFWGWSRGARFYPLLYMLTRVCHAKDWESGNELAQYALGTMASLELHHIFPKSLLYKCDAKYERSQVNALANFTFLTKETNLMVRDQSPEEYLQAYVDQGRGHLLASHWIPMDQELWKPCNYLDFLVERRKLLAEAANAFLSDLIGGSVPQPTSEVSVLEREVPRLPQNIASEDEETLLLETQDWLEQQGLPLGEFSYELTDQQTGESLGILDLAWPEGLQPGLSQPVALLIDEDSALEEAANAAGYRYFTDAEEFRQYVTHTILAETANGG